MSEHAYQLKLKWTGNTGEGTSSYRAYSRNHLVAADGKSNLECSADPAFLGDARKWNPEELLVASVSNCHMLWYLHLCADAGINVESYEDHPRGFMTINPEGGGSFSRIVLSPRVVITPENDPQLATELHSTANAKCFIASSLNFPVEHRAETVN